MVRQKYDHPKGMPKTPQGNLTNLSFSEHILQVLLFRIHLVVAPSVPFFVKKSKKALVLQHFRHPRWAQHGAPEGTSKMKKRAPRCMGTL